MGVVCDLLGDRLPEGVEGLHFHTLCESDSYDLEKTLGEVEKTFRSFPVAYQMVEYGRRTSDDAEGVRYGAPDRAVAGVQSQISES